MTKTHIPAIHPGLVLKDELEEIGVTQTQLATHIGVLPKDDKRDLPRQTRHQRRDGMETLPIPRRQPRLLAQPPKELGTKPGEGPAAEETRTASRLIRMDRPIDREPSK